MSNITYCDVWGPSLVALMYDDLSYVQKEVAREKKIQSKDPVQKSDTYLFCLGDCDPFPIDGEERRILKIIKLSRIKY